MTELERLTDLIKKARQQECLAAITADVDTAIDMPKGDEYLADYLLANGVICPPCKVGDTVYEIQPIPQRVQAYEVTTVKYNGKFYWFTWVLKDGVGVYGNVDGFTDLQLGKTVFLSRELAEKALAERSKG